MSFIRLALRLPAVAVLTVCCWLAVALVLPLRLVSQSLHVAIRRAIMRFWGKAFAWIVGMRVEIEGTPPTGTFYLVSNHVGYMDIILLSSVVAPAFVAKADLRGWPLMGRIMATADTIFIDRGRRKDVVRVMEAMAEAMKRGLGVVLFPEGTSGRGDAILKLKPSLLQFAASRDLPVHYATLSYSTPEGAPPPSETICWWGDAPFTPHVLGMLKLPYFEAHLCFAQKPVHDTDRKLLAEKLHEALSDQLRPMA